MRPDDLAACNAKLAAGSKSFALAARLLPRAVREPTSALYAFCREADDAVDGGDLPARGVEEQARRLDRVFSDRPADDPVERALAFVVGAHRLPRAPFDALLEGFAWDASARSYETVDDVRAYGARVAGTVGVMMTLLMGPRSSHVLARACELGMAMQLTNIARDVGEDASRGRLYLPRAWLRAAGVDPDAWLARPVADERVGEVVARVLADAEELYRSADAGIDALPGSCRASVRAARLVYAEIGRSIARARFDSVSRRATVSLARKLWLVARALLPHAKVARAALEAPGADAAAFLVSACAEAR